MSNIALLFESKKPVEKLENAKKLGKLAKENKYDINTLSLLDLAESCLGQKAMRAIRNANGDGMGEVLKESVDPVSLSAFNHITQLLILQNVVEKYQSPDFIGDQLFSQEVSREDNTREPGLALIDDKALVVNEGEEFPDVKFGEDYIDIPASKKRGLKIGLTREAIFFDRTGQIIELAKSVGDRLGTDREKRMLRVYLGIDNPFVRKGVARNTYVASADPRINSIASTPLIDWTSIDTVNQLFTAMNDDRTVGEPIQVTPNTLVVSKYRLMNAMRIVSATEIRTNTTVSGGVPAQQTYAANPANALSLKVLTSVWLDWLLVNENSISAANAKDYWGLGDPKRAFRYRTIFPLQVRASTPNDIDDFERDVVIKFRADERGVPYVRAPWYMAQAHNA